MAGGAPYLVGGGETSLTRFSNVYQRSISTRVRAEAVAAEVKAQAQEILEPFGKALRTDLVAASNRLEGYEWSRAAVRWNSGKTILPSSISGKS